MENDLNMRSNKSIASGLFLANYIHHKMQIDLENDFILSKSLPKTIMVPPAQSKRYG